MMTTHRKSVTVQSLHEVGLARLVFNADYRSFHGILINYQDESFTLRGVANQYQQISSEIDGHQKNGCQHPDICMDITVVEDETGGSFQLAKIGIIINEIKGLPNSVSCQFKSDIITFTTEELLVGNRADVEIGSYLSHDLLGSNTQLHLGTMSINLQTSCTPPPTPQRGNEPMAGDGDALMDENDDFLQ